MRSVGVRFLQIAMDYLPFLDVLHRAVLTSFLAVAIQALIMGAALLIWRKGEFFACLASWRVSLLPEQWRNNHIYVVCGF